ncbi:MAG TPA: ribosome-binding factor A [Candidatus Paceibacterota bacterium]|nr:ribosome-binding factor A [Candidatus Paceibacterota bacterium]
MRFFRSDRVSKLIREELSKIILREFEFGGALATITSVDVDKKLERAMINVSVLPAEREAVVVEELKRSAGRLQHLLNKKLNIRPMPRIIFAPDRGNENAAIVEKLLEEDNNGGDTIGHVAKQ